MDNGITIQISLITLESKKVKVWLEHMLVDLTPQPFQELMVEKQDHKEANLDITKKVEANMDMLQRARSFIKEKVGITKRDQRQIKNIKLDHTQEKLHLKLDLKLVNKKVLFQSIICKGSTNKFQRIMSPNLKLENLKLQKLYLNLLSKLRKVYKKR